MKRLLSLLLILAYVAIGSHAQLTLDYCIDKADQNYPLIMRYGLVEKTAAIDLSDINKSWLPRLSAYTQATAQNNVPAFPAPLAGILDNIGYDLPGISRLQYKVGIDLNQTVWDGGTSRAARTIRRAETAESDASIAVGLYAMHEKVMNLYFAILLIDKQIAQTQTTIDLLEANHARLSSMLANGTAMQADVDLLEARILATTRQLVEARSAALGYRDMLSIYIGEDVGDLHLERPSAEMPSDLNSARPELTMYDARLSLNAARLANVNTSVMPRIGFFAQAWYGYPGLNYFESMKSRDMSFNALAGIKVSWNIDSFYTRRNSRNRLAIAASSIENDRTLFLFNTGLQVKSQTDAIDGLRRVMSDDERIVQLYTRVRRAAESQLENGVIDTTALLSKITDESMARLTASYNEIRLIQSIYQLKYTLNR